MNQGLEEVLNMREYKLLQRVFNSDDLHTLNNEVGISLLKADIATLQGAVGKLEGYYNSTKDIGYKKAE